MWDVNSNMKQDEQLARVYIREAKDNDDIENYCKGMKAIIKKFKNLISNKELYNQNE